MSVEQFVERIVIRMQLDRRQIDGADEGMLLREIASAKRHERVLRDRSHFSATRLKLQVKLREIDSYQLATNHWSLFLKHPFQFLQFFPEAHLLGERHAVGQ